MHILPYVDKAYVDLGSSFVWLGASCKWQPEGLAHTRGTSF